MNIDYRFVGWYHDNRNRHDKVWGVINLPNHTYLTFWGRRGKKLQTNIRAELTRAINKLIFAKEDKGYLSITPDKLEEVYPEFQTDLEKTIAWAILIK